MKSSSKTTSQKKLPTEQKKKRTSNVITARHPNVKLDFKHVVWTARMYNEFDEVYEVDFVIINDGKIHSASDSASGEVIPLSKLKAIEKNLQNKVWDKYLMYAIFKLYS